MDGGIRRDTQWHGQRLLASQKPFQQQYNIFGQNKNDYDTLMFHAKCLIS